jgi:hypothetical protein
MFWNSRISAAGPICLGRFLLLDPSGAHTNDLQFLSATGSHLHPVEGVKDLKPPQGRRPEDLNIFIFLKAFAGEFSCKEGKPRVCHELAIDVRDDYIPVRTRGMTRLFRY